MRAAVERFAQQEPALLHVVDRADGFDGGPEARGPAGRVKDLSDELQSHIAGKESGDGLFARHLLQRRRGCKSRYRMTICQDSRVEPADFLRDRSRRGLHATIVERLRLHGLECASQKPTVDLHPRGVDGFADETCMSRIEQLFAAVPLDFDRVLEKHLQDARGMLCPRNGGKEVCDVRLVSLMYQRQRKRPGVLAEQVAVAGLAQLDSGHQVDRLRHLMLSRMLPEVRQHQSAGGFECHLWRQRRAHAQGPQHGVGAEGLGQRDVEGSVRDGRDRCLCRVPVGPHALVNERHQTIFDEPAQHRLPRCIGGD